MTFVYGFAPDFIFNIHNNESDLHNVLKAFSGLYLGFATLWIVGIYNDKFWNAATISNLIFMLGLAFGRIVSFVLDGFASPILIVGTFGELILGFYALYQYKKRDSKID